MSKTSKLMACICVSEGIMAKDSLPDAQPKQTLNLRVIREAPPHPLSCASPPNSSNNRQILEHPHRFCCPGVTPEDVGAQP